MLIAQDTTAYGIDLEDRPLLLPLLKELVQVEGLGWIRLLYAYPDHFGDDLAQFMLGEPKILNYLDLPIQHSHPGVLKRMCRKNTFELYDALFTKLRGGDPDFALRTTVITGFPGETYEEHNHLREYIERVKFDRLGVFKYVRERSTPSGRLEGHHTEMEKERRLKDIMAVQQENHIERNRSWMGRSIPSIIDGQTDDGTYIARTYRDAPDIDALVLVRTKKNLHSGQMVDVRVTGVDGYDLEGAF